MSGGHLGQEITLYHLKNDFTGLFIMVMCTPYASPVKPAAVQQGSLLHQTQSSGPLGTIMAGYPTQVMAVAWAHYQKIQVVIYTLSVGDYFTKWMEALPVPNQGAVMIAEKMVYEVFLRCSIPEQLHSDQGARFESQLMGEVCKLLHKNYPLSPSMRRAS